MIKIIINVLIIITIIIFILDIFQWQSQVTFPGKPNMEISPSYVQYERSIENASQHMHVPVFKKFGLIKYEGVSKSFEPQAFSPFR